MNVDFLELTPLGGAEAIIENLRDAGFDSLAALLKRATAEDMLNHWCQCIGLMLVGEMDPTGLVLQAVCELGWPRARVAYLLGDCWNLFDHVAFGQGIAKIEDPACRCPTCEAVRRQTDRHPSPDRSLN